jgi:hypothetical protein
VSITPSSHCKGQARIRDVSLAAAGHKSGTGFLFLVSLATFSAIFTVHYELGSGIGLMNSRTAAGARDAVSVGPDRIHALTSTPKFIITSHLGRIFESHWQTSQDEQQTLASCATDGVVVG